MNTDTDIGVNWHIIQIMHYHLFSIINVWRRKMNIRIVHLFHEVGARTNSRISNCSFYGSSFCVYLFFSSTLNSSSSFAMLFFDFGNRIGVYIRFNKRKLEKSYWILWTLIFFVGSLYCMLPFSVSSKELNSASTDEGDDDDDDDQIGLKFCGYHPFELWLRSLLLGVQFLKIISWCNYTFDKFYSTFPFIFIQCYNEITQKRANIRTMAWK